MFSDNSKKFSSILLERYYNNQTKKRVNLSSGNPTFSPFPPALRAIANTANNVMLSYYALGAGYENEKEQVIPFCESLNITPISNNNIIFGQGITHLYSMVLNIFADKFKTEKPNKKPVILMASPNYGLFTQQPEYFGYDVETFPLREENNYRIEAEIVAKKIAEINSNPDREVCLFYNANPHNPTGSLTTKKEIHALANVLKKHNVFAIDDMAYYGIEYISDKPTVLAETIFDNSVTLFSCSKAFCLPRMRAGFACGPNWLIDEINQKVAINMISLPATTAPIVTACYGTDNADAAKNFIEQNKTKYLKSLALVKAFISGVDYANTASKDTDHIITTIQNVVGDPKTSDEILKNGVQGIEFVNDNLEAGYFAMLRIKNLDKMFYGTTNVTNSFNFAAAAVDIGNVLTLPISCSVSNDNHDTLRVTFGGMSDRSIIRGLRGIFNTLKQLTPEPNHKLQAQLVEQGKDINTFNIK